MTLAPPVSRVNLYLSCLELANTDVLSKSDPQIFVFLKSSRTNNIWTEVGRTETVNNSLAPTFTTPIALDYFFEELQYVRFMVMDVDSDKTTSVFDHDFLGHFESTLAQIVCGSKVTRKYFILNPPNNEKF